MSAPIERQGVVRDTETGDLVIPASQRPDGTWRKARRVRDGYIPQEEVPVFESKGTQWLKSQPTHPIGLAPDDVAKMERAKAAAAETDPVPVQAPVHTSKAAKKNAKRKEKKKQEQTTAGGGSSVTQVTKTLEQTKLSTSNQDAGNDQDKDGNAELAKKLKNMLKKLKQIEELERKIQSGELKTPEKDQLEKVARKDQVLEEIEDLQAELEDS